MDTISAAEFYRTSADCPILGISGSGPNDSDSAALERVMKFAAVFAKSELVRLAHKYIERASDMESRAAKLRNIFKQYDMKCRARQLRELARELDPADSPETGEGKK